MFITLDIPTNTLRIEVDPPLDEEGACAAILDLATRGRLLGLEIGDRYLELDTRRSGDDQLTRSVPVTVTVTRAGRIIELSRSGPEWEIAFPSGNRCWRPVAGDDNSLRCEVVIPGAPRD